MQGEIQMDEDRQNLRDSQKYQKNTNIPKTNNSVRTFKQVEAKEIALRS